MHLNGFDYLNDFLSVATLSLPLTKITGFLKIETCQVLKSGFKTQLTKFLLQSCFSIAKIKSIGIVIFARFLATTYRGVYRERSELHLKSLDNF